MGSFFLFFYFLFFLGEKRDAVISVIEMAPWYIF